MRHLYLQFYLALVGAIALFGALLAAAWLLFPHEAADHRPHEAVAGALALLLPPAAAPPARQQEALDRLALAFPGDVTVRGPDGALLACRGAPIPDPGVVESGWVRSQEVLALHLQDGRTALLRMPHRHRLRGAALLLLGIAVAVGLGAYPVVRRVTARLERLRARVEALGAGDLAVRVKVEGSDEVADLARSFNRAADRLEQQVLAQRSLLANVSHELRTPLARLRLGLELLPDGGRPELRERLTREIGELDGLIGELLVSSRLQAGAEAVREPVELLDLVAEEAAAVGADVSGAPVRVPGDPRLLRRLLRNLLENARRHGGGAAVAVALQPAAAGRVLLRVEDGGPGIAPQYRERVFEPFYRVPGQVGEGTGLGLALVRQVARHHGGDVRCIASAGGGACFEVDLPVLP